VTKWPLSAWGTKGFEFWTLLSVLLKTARPRAILELGCGRSSTFFADYAHAYGATYVGIENDLRWFNKTTFDIDLLGFEKRHLARVTLAPDGSWYDLEGFRAATSDPGRFDFALIDAPNEKRFFASDAEIARRFRPEDGNPFGHRDDPTGLAAIKSVTSGCDVMMVDDVHKEHVFQTVDRMLSDPGAYERYYFVYRPHPTTTNGLCICLRRSAPWVGRLPAILDVLGVELERTYRPAGAHRFLRRLFGGERHSRSSPRTSRGIRPPGSIELGADPP
jgi:hypothetical protein